MQHYWPIHAPLEWKSALFHALSVCLFIISLFYYWFAIANRYVIFLYGHLGAPFLDERTTSRYWMSGLVASGAVMLLYTYANWFAGRVAGLRYQNFSPPAWWQVWILCVPPLTLSILFVTTTFNRPTLPISTAVACVAATLSGLALALMPGRLAAQQPSELGWLTLAGAGLIPSFLLLRALELPGNNLTGAPKAYLLAVGGTLAGAAWAIIITGLHAWRRQARWDARQIFIVGLCLSYVLMPLLHHLLLTPPQYRYISVSANFFALTPGIQIACCLAAACVAKGAAEAQRRVPAA